MKPRNFIFGDSQIVDLKRTKTHTFCSVLKNAVFPGPVSHSLPHNSFYGAGKPPQKTKQFGGPKGSHFQKVDPICLGGSSLFFGSVSGVSIFWGGFFSGVFRV